MQQQQQNVIDQLLKTHLVCPPAGSPPSPSSPCSRSRFTPCSPTGWLMLPWLRPWSLGQKGCGLTTKRKSLVERNADEFDWICFPAKSSKLLDWTNFAELLIWICNSMHSIINRKHAFLNFRYFKGYSVFYSKVLPISRNFNGPWPHSFWRVFDPWFSTLPWFFLPQIWNPGSLVRWGPMDHSWVGGLLYAVTVFYYGYAVIPKFS